METRSRVEEYWAGEFRCAVEAIRDAGVKVLGGRDGGAFVFRYGDSCVWHVPDSFVEWSVKVLAGRDAGEVFAEGAFRRVFGSAVRLVLGPCPLGYCDDGMLRRDLRLPACRPVGVEERAAVEGLAANCGEEAWEHGGIELENHPAVFGCFVDERMVSAASYEVWGETIAHVGVVTDPAYRGKGFAKSVAVAAADHALKRGLVPQWRTLASNVASVGVGRAIGFERLAEHFFVRLA